MASSGIRTSSRSCDSRTDLGIPKLNLPGTKQLTVSQLVERLGFGPAQVQVVLLSTFAVFFCDGCELTMLPLISMSTGQTFNLGHFEEAFMYSVCLFGLFVGNVCSGHFGDTFGRRPVILLSLGATATLGFFSSTVINFSGLLVTRCLLGIGMGLGMSPAMVYTSENCPESWRMRAQGVRSMGAGCFGPLLVSMLAGLDDPYLRNLNWRRMVVIVALFPAVFFLAGVVLLRESPVWLACVGETSAARAGFAEVKLQNGESSVDVNFEEVVHISKGKEPSTLEQLSVVFSRRNRFITYTLMLCSFMVNLAAYGDSYASSQVFPDITAIPAAWQISLKNALASLWIILSILHADSVSRKSAAISGLCGLAFASFAVAAAGAVAMPRSVGHEALFQIGINMIVFAIQMVFVVVFQISVEIYPPSVSSTGSAVVVATGRFGAMAAPLVFEQTRYLAGWWGAFYILLGSLCLLTAAVFMMVPGVEPFRVGETDAKGCGAGSECTKLEDGTADLKYGAARGFLASAGAPSEEAK